MEKMRLIVRDFEEADGLLPIWSTIYVELNKIAFPSETWTDATSSILTIWIYAVCRLFSRSTDEIILPFMDGDYAIEIRRLSGEEAYVSCIAPNNNLFAFGKIGLLHFGRQLLSATSKLAMHYADRHQRNQIVEVCTAAEKLREILSAKQTMTP